MIRLDDALQTSPMARRRVERQYSVKSSVDEVVLIDRESERASLEAAAAAALAGRGTLLLVSGEAGIGKTSLIRQALANSGLLVLEGRAHAGVPLPYGPLLMALRQRIIEHSTSLLSEVPETQRLALILPELGAVPHVADRAALFDALRVTLVSLVRAQPTALFLDDLHWADHTTLELLPALASELDHEPLLIVGAYRGDEIPRGHPVRRLRATLRQSGRLRELTIGPLDREQTAQLAARLLGAEPGATLAAALHARTEGVPFFIEELSSALMTGERLRHDASGHVHAATDELPLPESVRDAVGLQAADLLPQERHILDIAAVAGQEPDIDLLLDLAQADDEALASLFERRLLVDAGDGRAMFRHALTREACYLDVPWPRRRALHREVAAYLTAQGAAPAEVAEHWLAARDMERACMALVTAAEDSCRSHAYRDAVVAFRRALELWPDASADQQRRELLERVAACAERSGDLAEAARAWREASDARREAGETHEHALAERRLAGIAELRGDWERSLAARATAAAAFASIGQEAEAATERLLAAAHLRAASNYHAALALLDVARAEAEHAGRVDLLARILGHEGNARARLGDGAEGIALVRSALTLALEHNLPAAAADIYQRLADALEHAGDYTGAKDTYLDAFDYCQANAADTLAYVCLACLSVVLRQTGEWERAVAICRDALATPDTVIPVRAVASGSLGTICALRGDARAARPLLLQAHTLSRRIELAAMELLSAWGLLLVDDLNDAHAAAIERCRDLLARWRQTDERHYIVAALRWLTTYCAEQRADREAHDCAAALAEIAAATGQPEALTALSHALGELALLDDDPHQALPHFVQAFDLLRDQQLPFEQAHTERRIGNVLVLVGQREAGVARLTSAYRLARKLGARPLATRSASDLQALGEPVERRLGRRAAIQLSNSGLSPRELEVLRQVAIGHTSREVGQHLFLSPRTVEMHVQGILAKLDCRSRIEAVRKATELGLLDTALVSEHTKPHS
jgi:DNA-binding CsgD family transcriptional regulator